MQVTYNIYSFEYPKSPKLAGTFHPHCQLHFRRVQFPTVPRRDFFYFSYPNEQRSIPLRPLHFHFQNPSRTPNSAQYRESKCHYEAAAKIGPHFPPVPELTMRQTATRPLYSVQHRAKPRRLLLQLPSCQPKD